jgi:haloacetate dehalogenase
MSEDLADLFPGFASERIATQRGEIFARIGGEGPPLLLLHGYPQTHVMWHRIALPLAERFTLVVADLPGYGASYIPPTDREHSGYTKRVMAAALIEAMERIGHTRFALAGHDRGGRVAYRLALDHPERLSRVAVLDILPTYEYWARMDRRFALIVHNWTLLAQPYPLPEMLIEGDPDGYFGLTFRSWRKDGANYFDPRAVAHYLANFRDKARIHAACEDYRAGAYADYEIDKADREAGRKIKTPLLALWGSKGVAQAAGAPLETWKQWVENVTGAEVEGGHFIPEENPEGTLAAMMGFFGEG